MNFILPFNIRLSDTDLIKYYFNIKPQLRHKEICTILNEHHQNYTTPRQMKEICRKNKLSRKRNVDDHTLSDVITNELGTLTENIGYRQMTEIITLKYNLNVSKESVRRALLLVDPDGVACRKKKAIKRRVYETAGPMDVIHIDGNDKLKKFGFAIHGAIDGFSRKLLWLVVSTTNNDPLVIAHYFLNFLSRYKKAPSILRMDLGTENIYCEDLQVFFTKNSDSYLYAASVRNQRIEAFWSRLKKFNLSWWIDFFNDMIRMRLFKPSCPLHKEVLLFVFMPIIQTQLNQCIWLWNKRRIRQSATTPGGIPDILFHIPSTVGYLTQGYDVDSVDIQAAMHVLGIEHHPISENEQLHELLNCYVRIHNFESARDPESGLSLYLQLFECLEKDNFDI